MCTVFLCPSLHTRAMAFQKQTRKATETDQSPRTQRPLLGARVPVFTQDQPFSKSQIGRFNMETH